MYRQPCKIMATICTNVRFETVTMDDGSSVDLGFVTFADPEAMASVVKSMKPGLAKVYQEGREYPGITIVKVQTKPYKIGDKFVESITLAVAKGESVEFAAKQAKVELATVAAPQAAKAPENSAEVLPA